MFLVSVSLYRVCVGSFLCVWSLFLCLGVLGLRASFLVFWCFGFFFRCVCVLVSVCVGGLVFVSGLCVLFPVWLVLFGVACVSWVFCVCVCVAYCMVCALCVCSFIGCSVCFMCGVVSLLVCCVWCFGCWSLPVWLWWVSGFGRVLFFVFGFWLGFVFWLVAGVLFFVGRWCAGLVGGLFLLVVWVVFVCWGVGGCVLFFGAILFVLIVVGLSGFLLASAFCLVLQPVF